MTGHRFEIGEEVVHIEKRFPNGERRIPLMVVDRLAGAGEPHYRLSGPEALALCVLAESQLSPARPVEEAAHAAVYQAARAEALAADEPIPCGSPWPA
ncbi:MAG TPA: hypothetical protein VF601_22995 [Beijerinckiaceae bacterium]|jgi:hypothetical protein